ncbi:MAG: endonuclease III [Clostridia bacterium]|nr:endonuclease III [Clostridia bacterium]
MDQIQIDRVFQTLNSLYPDADTELEFRSDYELLVAVMLSAQCTDKRVNQVTKGLFAEFNTPEKMLTLSQEALEQKIFSCGFYRNKAKNILATSRALVDEYGGQVPHDWEALQRLPGVGRKTANVVAAIAFDIPAIAVDTHVFRVANRIGLATAKDELHTELQLQKCFPEEKWLRAHHLILWHGRRCCDARKPKCGQCPLSQDCRYFAQLDHQAPSPEKDA